jgi:hypothetical protein
MKYTVLSTMQLLIMTLLTGLLAGALSIGFVIWRDYKLLPIVATTVGGECIKVLNLQNGHAFSCPDKDVLLRQYRVQVLPVEAKASQ